MFFPLLEAFFGSRIESREREVHFTPDEKQKSEVSSTSKPSGKFDDDIEKLESRYGSLKTGLCIETTLQDMLALVPRNRPRVDAYQGLISHLKDMGVTLIIKSRKSK